MRRAGAIIVASIGLLPCAGHAGFVVERSIGDATGPVQASAVPTRSSAVTNVGAPAAPLAPVNGSGRGQPFGAAMRMIVPDHWSAFSGDKALKLVAPVSWSGGGRPWPVVLEDILLETNLRAVINWPQREVTVYPAVTSR